MTDMWGTEITEGCFVKYMPRYGVIGRVERGFVVWNDIDEVSNLESLIPDTLSVIIVKTQGWIEA